MEVKLGVSNIVTAFDNKTIGSKVINKVEFFCMLEEEIKNFSFLDCRQPGQAYMELPEKFNKLVSAGVGKRTLNPDDYVVRLYREKVGLYLKRKFASKVNKVACVVYTIDAYLNDPDLEEEEKEFLGHCDFTHMLVAVLAFADNNNPLTPNRFIHNLAGGNNEALLWTADEIREKAKEINTHSKEWCPVAD